MHIVPTNEEVTEYLDDIRREDVVTLRGYLMSIRGDESWYWRSSLSRTDRSNGAREVV
jgi:hypothetical protein